MDLENDFLIKEQLKCKVADFFNNSGFNFLQNKFQEDISELEKLKYKYFDEIFKSRFFIFI